MVVALYNNNEKNFCVLRSTSTLSISGALNQYENFNIKPLEVTSYIYARKRIYGPLGEAPI